MLKQKVRSGACVCLLLFAHPALSAGATRFTDMNQRQVLLDKPAERIVVIPIPAASTLISVDGDTQRLAGMHPFAKVAASIGILAEMFPATLNIRSDTVGNNFMPNIETLLAVKPDLVWQWGHRGSDIITPMEKAGLTVATLLYGKEEYAQRWITLMGISLGQEDKATRLNAWRNATLAELAKSVSDIPPKTKPRVLYLARFLKDIQTFGATSHNNHDIELAGGISITANLTGSRTVNIEQLLAWNPDIILLGNFETQGTPQHIYDNPLLADISAVKQHRVYKLPVGGFIWDAPNQESPLYWKWLAMLFHPHKLYWPLRQEIKQQYAFIYGYTPTERQIDGILQTGLNNSAAHYSMFRGTP